MLQETQSLPISRAILRITRCQKANNLTKSNCMAKQMDTSRIRLRMIKIKDQAYSSKSIETDKSLQPNLRITSVTIKGNNYRQVIQTMVMKGGKLCNPRETMPTMALMQEVTINKLSRTRLSKRLNLPESLEGSHPRTGGSWPQMVVQVNKMAPTATLLAKWPIPTRAPQRTVQQENRPKPSNRTPKMIFRTQPFNQTAQLKADPTSSQN